MGTVILAGDVGGTNTRLALFEVEGDLLTPIAVEVFPSRKYESLDLIVQNFIKAYKNPPVEYACFGVAGPVKHGCSETPNLAWIVCAHKLANVLSLRTVELINDLEANAYGIPALGSEDFVVLNEGDPNMGSNAALISAGTGLGQAGLYWKGDHYHPFPSEGGHADFAPRNELEIELLAYMLQRYEHVSYERVLSGPGLYNIYKFLRDAGRGEEPTWLAERLHLTNPPAVIAQAALEESCELCVQALDMFVSIYGAEAGNVALKFLATGGVFVGGGIAPKIIHKLRDNTFMKGFVEKGRMRSLLESIPVRVILNDKTALLGAARMAALSASKT